METRLSQFSVDSVGQTAAAAGPIYNWLRGGGGGMDTGVVAPSTADTSYVTEKRGAYVSVLVKLHYL